MSTDPSYIDPKYGTQLTLGNGESIFGEDAPEPEIEPAPPIVKSANGLIVGGNMVNIGDSLVLVVQVEIGEGQIVHAGLGAEATNNLLIAAGQRNGLVSVTFNAETMEGITFAPRPAKV